MLYILEWGFDETFYTGYLSKSLRTKSSKITLLALLAYVNTVNIKVV